jgi:hypothetical protein
MNRLGKAMALLLAVLWLPIATHCDLANLPGLEFLACCDHSDVAPHQDENCRQDACDVVESGNYKVEERPVSVPAPALLAVFLLPLVPDNPPALQASPNIATSTPPELPQRWQFVFRTALPPRAPSIAS